MIKHKCFLFSCSSIWVLTLLSYHRPYRPFLLPEDEWSNLSENGTDMRFGCNSRQLSALDRSETPTTSLSCSSFRLASWVWMPVLPYDRQLFSFFFFLITRVLSFKGKDTRTFYLFTISTSHCYWSELPATTVQVAYPPLQWHQGFITYQIPPKAGSRAQSTARLKQIIF